MVAWQNKSVGKALASQLEGREFEFWTKCSIFLVFFLAYHKKLFTSDFYNYFYSPYIFPLKLSKLTSLHFCNKIYSILVEEQMNNEY